MYQPPHNRALQSSRHSSCRSNPPEVDCRTGIEVRRRSSARLKQTLAHSLWRPLFPLLPLASLVLLAFAGCRTPDYTTGQPSVCEVHHVAMTKRALPFAHGMIPMSREQAQHGEWKRRMDHYPHPGDCIPATDILLPRQEGRALDFVCAECKRAKRQMETTGP